MIQDIIVFFIVALAVAFLARTWFFPARVKKGCGCSAAGGCPKAGNLKVQTSAPPNLVQIDLSGGRKLISTQQPPGRDS